MINKTMLITGCCGFIGSHLCDYFLSKNFNVIGLDNLLTGNIENINHLNSNKSFEYIEFDICDKFRTKKKIDYILHFASPASPVDYLKYPIKTLQIGSKGTENILELGLKNIGFHKEEIEKILGQNWYNFYRKFD